MIAAIVSGIMIGYGIGRGRSMGWRCRDWLVSFLGASALVGMVWPW